MSILADKKRMYFFLQKTYLRGRLINYRHQHRPKAKVYHSFSDHPGLLTFFLMVYYKERLKCSMTKRLVFLRSFLTASVADKSLAMRNLLRVSFKHLTIFIPVPDTWDLQPKLIMGFLDVYKYEARPDVRTEGSQRPGRWHAHLLWRRLVFCMSRGTRV